MFWNASTINHSMSQVSLRYLLSAFCSLCRDRRKMFKPTLHNGREASDGVCLMSFLHLSLDRNYLPVMHDKDVFHNTDITHGGHCSEWYNCIIVQQVEPCVLPERRHGHVRLAKFSLMIPFFFFPNFYSAYCEWVSNDLEMMVTLLYK